MINILFRKEKNKEGVTNENILDGEIVDDKKEKDE